MCEQNAEVVGESTEDIQNQYDRQQAAPLNLDCHGYNSSQCSENGLIACECGELDSPKAIDPHTRKSLTTVIDYGDVEASMYPSSSQENVNIFETNHEVEASKESWTRMGVSHYHMSNATSIYVQDGWQASPTDFDIEMQHTGDLEGTADHLDWNRRSKDVLMDGISDENIFWLLVLWNPSRHKKPHMTVSSQHKSDSTNSR